MQDKKQYDVLFALRVKTCVELYNGVIDFSSLAIRVSKLERMAIKDGTKSSILKMQLTSHTLGDLPGLVEVLLKLAHT